MDTVWRIWVTSDNRLTLPKSVFPLLAKIAHGANHVAKGWIARHWYTPGFSTFASKFCKQYAICFQMNIAKWIQMTVGAQSTPSVEYQMVDFVELSPIQGCRYCLVIVDMTCICSRNDVQTSCFSCCGSRWQQAEVNPDKLSHRLQLLLENRHSQANCEL